MKSCIKNTTLCTIAFLFLIIGNSVNAIHFCCDICGDRGSQVFTDNICHEQPVIWKIQDIKVNPSVVKLFFSPDYRIFNLADKSITAFKPSLYTFIINSTGRQILNEICVLRN